MNAKELRQAAERQLNYDESSDAEIDQILRHILATVREDDDEEFDESKAAKLLGEKYEIKCTETRLFIMDHDKSLPHIGVSCRTPETMGQFRKLCEGLGIQLKEKAHGS